MASGITMLGPPRMTQAFSGSEIPSSFASDPQEPGISIRGEIDAPLLAETLQERLDSLAAAGPSSQASHVLKQLQDVCSSLIVLPPSYQLSDVQVNLRRRIGGGGEAAIFLGSWNSQVVAVREIYPPENGEWTSAAGTAKLQTVVREIVTHHQLQHENILPLLGVHDDEDNTSPMMVLPYYENGSALKYLQTHDTPEAFCKIVIGASSGLAYLHSRDPPVVHGDLHSGNVLVNEEGEAVLCDFGLSRFRHESTRTLTLIQTGGKTRFLAPELTAGHDLFRTTEATDTYGMAMTFFELGTGLSPFYHIPNELAAMALAQRGARPDKSPPFRGLDPPVFEVLWGLMTAMWAQEPYLRPSSAAVFVTLSSQLKPPGEATALVILVSSSSTTSSTGRVHSSPSRSRSSSRCPSKPRSENKPPNNQARLDLVHTTTSKLSDMNLYPTLTPPRAISPLSQSMSNNRDQTSVFSLNSTTSSSSSRGSFDPRAATYPRSTAMSLGSIPRDRDQKPSLSRSIQETQDRDRDRTLPYPSIRMSAPRTSPDKRYKQKDLENSPTSSGPGRPIRSPKKPYRTNYRVYDSDGKRNLGSRSGNNSGGYTYSNGRGDFFSISLPIQSASSSTQAGRGERIGEYHTAYQ